MHIHDTTVARPFGRIAPDFFEHLLPLDRCSGLLEKQHQQIELHLRQTDSIVVPVHLPPREIDAQISDLNSLTLGGGY